MSLFDNLPGFASTTARSRAHPEAALPSLAPSTAAQDVVRADVQRLLSGLNPNQRAAVEHTEAAADRGGGRLREDVILTHRIAH